MFKVVKVFSFTLFTIVIMAFNVSAIIIDGNFTDWFPNVTGFQVTDNIANDATGEIDHGFTNGIYWSEEDYVASGTYGQVYPGYGGQSFDHEGLYLTEDVNTYYVGFMTGMAPGANHTSWSTTDQYVGDIAFDTSNGYDMAISMGHIRDMTGVAFLHTGVSSWNDTNYYNPLYDPTPYTVNTCIGSYEINFAYNLHGDSYFYEFGIDKSLLDLTDGLTAFVTMSCGNDWLQTTNHPPSVPEPTTMLLLGTGLLGMGSLGKKKYFK